MTQKTPEEYAQKLVDKYADIILIEASMSDTAEDANAKILAHHSQAKQCALIDVQNTINEVSCFQDLVSVWQNDIEQQTVIQRLKCLEQTKQHLQNL